MRGLWALGLSAVRRRTARGEPTHSEIYTTRPIYPLYVSNPLVVIYSA